MFFASLFADSSPHASAKRVSKRAKEILMEADEEIRREYFLPSWATKAPQA